MYTLLEAYLSEVAAHLGPLPPKRRAEELREMRAHLVSVFAASREQGRDEAEAAQNAAEQFGPPEAVARATGAAWRRGVLLDARSLCGAAACVMALSSVLTALVDRMDLWLPHKFFMGLGDAWADLHFVVYALAGLAGGLLFPRRALAGAALWAAVWLACVVGPILLGTHWVHEPAVWVGDYVEFAFLAVLGAEAGGWWRGATPLPRSRPNRV